MTIVTFSRKLLAAMPRPEGYLAEMEACAVHTDQDNLSFDVDSPCYRSLKLKYQHLPSRPVQVRAHTVEARADAETGKTRLHTVQPDHADCLRRLLAGEIPLDHPCVQMVRQTGDRRHPQGPGDRFHDLLHRRFGLTPCSRCKATAGLMNAAGAEGCRQLREAILEDLWSRRGLLKGWKKVFTALPGAKGPALLVLGQLFDEALKRTEESKTVTKGDETDGKGQKAE